MPDCALFLRLRLYELCYNTIADVTCQAVIFLTASIPVFGLSVTRLAVDDVFDRSAVHKGVDILRGDIYDPVVRLLQMIIARDMRSYKGVSAFPKRMIHGKMDGKERDGGSLHELYSCGETE